MPIKGLTTDREAQFMLLGRLRKGAKAQGNVGRDLDYFRFTAEDKDPKVAAAVEAEFTKLYGDKPTNITCFLPFLQVDQVFAAWKEEWTKQGLGHRCDGDDMVVWRDPNGSGFIKGKKPCPYTTGEKQRTRSNPGCKEIGRLTILLPELVKATGRVGYVLMETHSKHDIANIYLALEAARDAAGQRGWKGIPFTLRRFNKDIFMPTDQGRVKVKKSLVIIEPLAEWIAAQMADMSRLALNASSTVTIEGRAVDVTTGEVITGEIVVATWEDVLARAGDEKGFIKAVKSTYKVDKSGDLTQEQLDEISYKLSLIAFHDEDGEELNGYTNHPIELTVEQLSGQQGQGTTEVPGVSHDA